MSVYESIVDQRAEELTTKIISKVIRDLQAIKIILTGDDSPLINTWDEICVQIQDERFLLWEPYQLTIEEAISDRIKELTNPDLCALWLQTNSGKEYYSQTQNDSISYSEADIIDYLCQLLLARADDWGNSRIRKYLTEHSI